MDNPIKSYQDLAEAINLIAAGDRNHTDYSRTTGLNRERLILAESWRDRGVSYEIADIVGLNFQQIRSELGYGKARFGRVYPH